MAFGRQEVSAEATDNSGAAAAPGIPVSIGVQKWRLPMRPFKVGIAASMLVAGAYGVLSEQNFVSSTNAIVSAYVVCVRTPIDGTVNGLPATANSPVRQGDIIGRVDNPRVDQQQLENLRVIEERAKSEAEALAVERASLERQREALLARAAAHASAVAARLQLQGIEDQRLLQADQETAKQAKRDLERGRQLHDAGIISVADLEKLESQYDIACRQAEAQQAVLARNRTEADSAKKGIYIEPGDNEIDYSRQRADEIRLRLADIDHNLPVLESQAAAAERDLEEETKRTQLMSRADLVSPISGLLWKLEAINGERVGTGDSVAEFVDCEQSFVLVEIPQERIPGITIGAQARIKLSGESFERTGTIRSISGDREKGDNRKLAAIPTMDTVEQSASVWIDLDPASLHGECIVGRTARVLLPSGGSSLASRWMRKNF